jgi:hypothetical protein
MKCCTVYQRRLCESRTAALCDAGDGGFGPFATGFWQCAIGLYAAARKAILSPSDTIELFNPVINILGVADLWQRLSHFSFCAIMATDSVP